MKRSAKNKTLISVCLMASPLLASAENSFDASISITSGITDNARKTSEDAAVDERQDQYQINVRGEYTNTWLDGQAVYQAVERRFAEASQSDESYLDGQSSVLLGNSASPVDMQLRHSRRTLLREPDQVSLTDNLDARDIYTAIPRARLRLTDSDTLSLSGDFTKIHYRHNPERDSERQGATLELARLLSKTSSLMLLGQQLDIEFEQMPQMDYRYENAAIVYSAQLRQLTYSLQVGYNQTDNQFSGAESAPSYQINLGYESGTNQLTFQGARQITDSSIGDGNVGDFTNMPGGDGRADIRQMERTSTLLRWDTALICESCSAYLSFSRAYDDYLDDEQSAELRTVVAGFSYQFSRVARLNLRAEQSLREFSDPVLGQDYDLNRFSAEFRYDFIGHLGLSLLATREDRSGKAAINNYVENYVGLSLSYQFQ